MRVLIHAGVYGQAAHIQNLCLVVDGQLFLRLLLDRRLGSCRNVKSWLRVYIGNNGVLFVGRFGVSFNRCIRFNWGNIFGLSRSGFIQNVGFAGDLRLVRNFGLCGKLRIFGECRLFQLKLRRRSGLRGRLNGWDRSRLNSWDGCGNRCRCRRRRGRSLGFELILAVLIFKRVGFEITVFKQAALDRFGRQCTVLVIQF